MFLLVDAMLVQFRIEMRLDNTIDPIKTLKNDFNLSSQRKKLENRENSTSKHICTSLLR